MINKLSNIIHENAIDKGFYEDEINIAELIALIHSEVSEALEADREFNFCMIEPENLKELDAKEYEKHVKHTFQDELADIMIRVMDLARYCDVDLEAHILAKIKYSSQRPYKHGKKY